MQALTHSHLQKLPSIDQLLQHCESLCSQFGREIVLGELKAQLDSVRHSVINGQLVPQSRDSLIELIRTQSSDTLTAQFAPSLRPVYNLSGVILHTNLGRAPYPQSAIDAMVAVSAGACNLEYDLATGKRGRRDDHVEKWICELTGAEAATTVNNNAAAVLLTLNTLAGKGEVLVSRGELIEIGGSFRMPAIMKKAGCKLREVGTTNRTHLRDYEAALNKRTAAIMKVHTSNYEIKGFNKSVTAAALVPLAVDNDVPLIDDMGSGNLVDLTALGLPAERTAREALDEGVDVITFSGDKLLGGPQCGIIAGRKDIITRIDSNPMKRAMRLDKLTLAALESVLKLYTTPENLCKELPALRMLTKPLGELHKQAAHLNTFFFTEFDKHLDCTIEDSECQIGSGALPTKTIDSIALSLSAKNHSVESLAKQCRDLPTPVIGRISKDRLFFDLRAIEDIEGFQSNFKQLVL